MYYIYHGKTYHILIKVSKNRGTFCNNNYKNIFRNLPFYNYYVNFVILILSVKISAMMEEKVKYYIEKMGLEKHPEGGYFKEIYRSGEYIETTSLPDRYKGDRVFSTSIYFLLEKNQKSVFHRLQSDETWHFYDGGTVKVFMIDENSELSEIRLGRNIEKDERLQFTIPKNCWFAAELEDKKSFCLVGCTVAPGFEFSDFEMGSRESLIEKYPAHKELITRLTSGNK